METRVSASDHRHGSGHLGRRIHPGSLLRPRRMRAPIPGAPVPRLMRFSIVVKKGSTGHTLRVDRSWARVAVAVRSANDPLVDAAATRPKLHSSRPCREHRPQRPTSRARRAEAQSYNPGLHALEPAPPRSRIATQASEPRPPPPKHPGEQFGASSFITFLHPGHSSSCRARSRLRGRAGCAQAVRQRHVACMIIGAVRFLRWQRRYNRAFGCCGRLGPHRAGLARGTTSTVSRMACLVNGDRPPATRDWSKLIPDLERFHQLGLVADADLVCRSYSDLSVSATSHVWSGHGWAPLVVLRDGGVSRVPLTTSVLVGPALRPEWRETLPTVSRLPKRVGISGRADGPRCWARDKWRDGKNGIDIDRVSILMFLFGRGFSRVKVTGPTANACPLVSDPPLAPSKSNILGNAFHGPAQNASHNISSVSLLCI